MTKQIKLIDYTGPQKKLSVLGVRHMFFDILFSARHESKVKIGGQSLKNGGK